MIDIEVWEVHRGRPEVGPVNLRFGVAFRFPAETGGRKQRAEALEIRG